MAGESTDIIKIQVGKLKGVGYLRPGDNIFPVDVQRWPVPIGGVFYDALVVECPGYSTDEEPDPTAVIPPLLYTSKKIRGEVLHYMQVPVKYGMLHTTHALTGQSAKCLMLTLDYYWSYDAVFSAMTRASEPPPPVGHSLSGRNGAVGIAFVNKANGRFFDPCYLSLGLHPKVALLFHDVYDKPVPEERIRSARKWLDDHRSFHLSMEEATIQKRVARESAGPSMRRYDD